MALIVFPFDYDERTHPSVVPICIRDTDDAGRRIHRGWFDRGVPPVADRLRSMAHRVLGIGLALQRLPSTRCTHCRALEATT